MRRRGERTLRWSDVAVADGDGALVTRAPEVLTEGRSTEAAPDALDLSSCSAVDVRPRAPGRLGWPSLVSNPGKLTAPAPSGR